MQPTTDILRGYIIENETRLTLHQLCDACAVQAEYIIELVNEGVIEPTGMENSHWCFSGISISRVRRAKHLQHDLGVNPAGIGLALELLDEIEQLRSRLQHFSS